MGESRRPSRVAEIAEKKKTEKIRLRLHRTREYSPFISFHFKNRAARTAAGEAAVGLRNSLQVTKAVSDRLIGEKFVKRVQIKAETVKITPVAKRANKARPLVLVPGRKLNADEWLMHISALIEVAKGGGWRMPSAKAKNWQSTSAIMRASQAAGLSGPNTFERSDRGKKKLQARLESNALITIDRLIEQFPDRVTKAKHSERLLNWFIAFVEERYDVDREWLAAQVKEKIKDGGRNPKFLHSKARDWLVPMTEAA